MAPNKRRLALLSVFEKAGIVEFARALIELGFDILASGGTAKFLAAAGIPVMDVAELVGGKAILGHRVVTLSRELYAALLATESEEDIAELERLGIRRIDLVCVDMYPLQEEIKNLSATIQSVIGKTDVGGPTMLHGGAKGQRIVVCDPADREHVLEWLRNGMPYAEPFIQALMAKAEFTVSRYVFDSARYHGKGMYDGFFGERMRKMRYGENPHQKNAIVYQDPDAKGNPFAPGKFNLVGGDGPSYINMTDLDRLLTTARRIATGFKQNKWGEPMIAIAVKHGNVCGVGVADSPVEAFQKMVLSDPTSLSGGCVMVNFDIDFDCADFMRSGGSEEDRVLDTVIAPQFTDGAKNRLTRKNGKCRMFVNPALENLGEKGISTSLRFRQIEGGFLTQDPDMFVLKVPDEWKTTLTLGRQRDMVIAWGIGSTSNSNTIVLVYDGYLLGRGIAQPSRVLACKVALLHARENGHESEIPKAAAYSDSFFPFDDGPTVLAEAGIKFVFATSGSIRNDEVNEACNRLGIKQYQLPDKEARGFFGH